MFKVKYFFCLVFITLLCVNCQRRQESGQPSTARADTATALTVDDVDLMQYFPDTLLTRFQDEVEAFSGKDSAWQGGALFVGSSSIRFWESLQQDMQPVPVLNRGFGGSTIPEVLYYFDQLVLPYHPKVIVLYAGENDLATEGVGITPKQVKETFEVFVNTVRAKLPEAEKIYYIAVKPSVARWSLWPRMQQANQLIRDYASQQAEVVFVDVAAAMMEGDEVKQDIFVEDNLHMNSKGYALWTGLLRPMLLEDFKGGQ